MPEQSELLLHLARMLLHFHLCNQQQLAKLKVAIGNLQPQSLREDFGHFRYHFQVISSTGQALVILLPDRHIGVDRGKVLKLERQTSHILTQDLSNPSINARSSI